MGTNNLGRTNVVVGDDGKEVLIAASDDALDAALTAELEFAWSGADALKSVSTAQCQGAFVFTMTGTTSDGAPTLKFPAVQRGMVLVKNETDVLIYVRDYTSSTFVLCPANTTVAMYVSADAVVKIFESVSATLPDTSIDACRVATTANITIATALNSGDTIDGVVLADGDRVMVWKQTTASENGVYVVDASPYRATDFDEDIEVLAGTLVAVTEGTANGDQLYMMTTNNPVIVGTTAIVFKRLSQNAVAFATAAQLYAGTNATRSISPSVLSNMWKKGSSIASAGTLSVGSGRYFRVTGTTTITDIDFASASLDGRECVLEFAGALTLTNSANLVLPGGADITTAAGDIAGFVQYNADEVHCVWYTRADGTAVVNAAFSAASTTELLTAADNTKAATPLNLYALWGKGTDTASAGTLVIDEGGYLHVTGTTTITDIDFATAVNGRAVTVVFDGILTLTHNATTLKLPSGANIVTAAGDRACFVQDSSDNVICLWYTRADGTPLVGGTITAASTTELLTGTDTAKTVTADAVAALWEKGSAVASAATLSLGEGGYFHVTGTTTITDIDFATAKNGRKAILVFDGSLTLTHNATTLLLPGGANITTAANDRACFVQDAGDNVYCAWYQRADGTALVASGFTAASTTETLTGTSTTKALTPDSAAALWEQGSNVASAATVSLGEGGHFHITGTTTITDIDFATDKAGRRATVTFDGALTLTHNATTLILPGGANITTAAGDTMNIVSEGSDVIRVTSYTKADGTAITASGFTAASTTEVLTGTNTTKGATPDAIAALWEKGSDVASAATISLGEGGFFHITGTTTITDIDFATDKSGRHAILVFDGALTLTHNATTLILPGGANITTAAGDACLVVSEDGSDNVRVVWYQRASGKSVRPATQTIAIACSDETTAITTGTAKATFRMPYAFTLTEVRASVTTAPTGAILIIDINESGSTIMTTNKLSIDASEKTSTTAATAAGLTDTALADDAEITIDFDQVGSTVAGAGVKVYLIGYPTNG